MGPNERMVAVGDVELCVETFGDVADPAVLLIGGMSSSMDWWDDEFCRRLAGGGRHVIRYDLRDTGRSTTYPPGEPGYVGSDLRDDVIGLLDALGIDGAHLVGISMGGGMAQGIALHHPDRVRSLTLIATSAAVPGAPEDLPPPTPEMQAYFESAPQRPQPEPSDRAGLVDMLVEDQQAFAGDGFDEPRVRAVVGRVLDRTIDIRSTLQNHGAMGDGAPVVGTLADIATPTLVIHGTADPLFPIEHGRALADSINGATLLPLDGMGHETPPPRTWDVVIPALLRHTAT